MTAFFRSLLLLLSTTFVGFSVNASELICVPNELGRLYPPVMSPDDVEYRGMFPSAVGSENAWWHTLGPDRFNIYKYSKYAGFRERRGHYAKAPRSSQWVILLGEDDENFYFQWVSPDVMGSPEWKVNRRRERAGGSITNDRRKGADLEQYLGAPGHRLKNPELVSPELVEEIRFADSSRGLPDSGLWQMHVAVVDVNDDGFLDIVSTPPRKSMGSQPVIWLGDGGDNWALWKEARFPTDISYDYGDVEVADFDGDGHQDLALAMHYKGIAVLYGDSKGDFTSYFRFFDGSGFTSRAIEIGDFDKDGSPDVAVFSEINMDLSTNMPVVGRMLRVFLYRQRDWFAPRDEGTTPHLFGDEMATGDLDGDGWLDIIVSSHVHGHTALLHLNKQEKGWKVWREKLIGSAHYWGVAADDVDGDGHLDVVLGFVASERGSPQSNGGIALFRGTGDGLADPELLVVDPFGVRYTFIEIADLDNDGRKDILTASTSGQDARILLQKENGFVQEDVPELGKKVIQGLEVVDVNGDGWPDLIVNQGGEQTGGAIRCLLRIP